MAHVVQRSDYGHFITWSAIHRSIRDSATRCELFRIAAALPDQKGAKGGHNLEEAIKKECAD